MADAPRSTELRERVFALTYACPKLTYEARCPFGMLRGLSFESRRDMVGQMDDAALLQLFDLVPECRCSADPRRTSAPP